MLLVSKSCRLRVFYIHVCFTTTVKRLVTLTCRQVGHLAFKLVGIGCIINKISRRDLREYNWFFAVNPILEDMMFMSARGRRCQVSVWSVGDIFMLGSFFLCVRIAVGGNSVRPNGIRASTSFHVPSRSFNALLHLNYVEVIH